MADAALIICTRRGARGRRAPADDRSSAADGRPRRRIRGEAGSGGGGGGRRVRADDGWVVGDGERHREGEGGASAESNPEHGEKKKNERKNELTEERKKERKGEKNATLFTGNMCKGKSKQTRRRLLRFLAPLRDRSPLRSHARRLPPGRLC